MAKSEISKQTVKNYLEYQGKDLGNEMKSKMEKKDNWSEFKNELAVSIATYAKKPTFQTKQKLSDLISINFSTNLSFGRDALDEILKDLGIGNLELEVNETEKTSKDSQTRIEYRRAIFNDLGYEFPDDIVESLNKQWQDEQDKKYGIVRKNSKIRAVKKKEKPKKIELEELEEEEKPEKEDSKIKKALKKAYFKVTASIIMAPGKVPEEVLAENRELFKESSEKLDKMIAEVNKARDIIINQNHSSLANIPEDLQELYSQMSDGNFAEIDLENFESELKIKSSEQVSQMREKFEILQKQKLENKLRKLAEEKGLTGQELEDEIEYAVLDSKLDEDGELVLPAHSIFKEIFDNNIKATPADIIKTKLITYLSSPKISELSDEEIMNLGKNFGYPQKMNPNSKEYAIDNYFMNNPEILPDNFHEIRNDIRTISNQHIAVTRMLEETELRHKSIILDEIQSQFSKIDEIIQRCDDKEASNGELDRKDSKKREIVLKIARNKVNSLEKAGLSQVVSEGEKKQKGLLKRAKGILMPDLENAKNKQAQRLQEEYKIPEEQEQ